MGMCGNQSNIELANNYLNWISNNYSRLKNKYWKFCKENGYTFDEDVFSDTILRCYDIIYRNGLKDTSDYGMESYTFIAFRNNIRNERNYSRVKKRDFNINSDNIHTLYEEYYNENNSDAVEKIVSDLYKDFCTLYIMMQVENNFPQEHFYLFRIKTLTKGMTFKKLQEQTKIKASRLKVIEVQRWLKENVKAEEVKNAFFKFYGDLI